MNEIILGGGIAGMLWALYNPDSVLITDKIGGQFSAPFQLGPKYLHYKPSSIRLLKDLVGEYKEKYPVKEIKVGFYYDGRIHSENTEENRKKYFYKTRGEESGEVYRSAMSGGASSFLAFDIGVDDLIDLISLKLKNKIIIDKIKEIDILGKILIGEKELYSFDRLIVTIPKPIFCLISGDKEESKKYLYHPTTFVKKEFPIEEKPIIDYDYVYFSEPDFLFHRITNIGNNNYIYEYKGEFSQPTDEYYILKIGQIVQRKEEKQYPEYIKFFGRYATWHHSVLTNVLLDEIYAKIL